MVKPPPQGSNLRVAGRTELELPPTRNGHPKVPHTTRHSRSSTKTGCFRGSRKLQGSNPDQPVAGSGIVGLRGSKVNSSKRGASQKQSNPGKNSLAAPRSSGIPGEVFLPLIAAVVPLLE